MLNSTVHNKTSSSDTMKQYSLSTVCFSATSSLGAATMTVNRYTKAKSRSIFGPQDIDRNSVPWLDWDWTFAAGLYIHSRHGVCVFQTMIIVDLKSYRNQQYSVQAKAIISQLFAESLNITNQQRNHIQPLADWNYLLITIEICKY